MTDLPNRIVPTGNIINTKKNRVPRSVVSQTIKEYIHFQGEQISNILEKIEEPNRLEYYEDVWTLVHPNGLNTAGGFVFTPETTKQGYMSFPPDAFKTLNLVDNKNKMVIPLGSSVYHFLAEDVADIIKILNTEEYKNLELIIDVSSILDFMYKRTDYDMYWLFLKSLNDKKIKHKVVNFKDYGAIYIDNFFLVSNSFSEFERFNNTYNYFLDYITDKTTTPTRKVYLSRTKVPGPTEWDYTDPKTGDIKSAKASRFDDHDRLEKIFKKLGFEIVYPEDFKTFEDQINFFYSVKVVASLTSSGLTNSIFMQPGGTIVEVITPLTARPIAAGVQGFLNKEFHNYYKNLAATKKHLYIGLPCPHSTMDELEEFFVMNESALKLLKQVK
jgi:hypothetical protein